MGDEFGDKEVEKDELLQSGRKKMGFLDEGLEKLNGLGHNMLDMNSNKNINSHLKKSEIMLFD